MYLCVGYSAHSAETYEPAPVCSRFGFAGVYAITHGSIPHNPPQRSGAPMGKRLLRRPALALQLDFSIRLGLALVLTLGASLVQARAPQVLVTIKPLQLIATAIAGDQLVINRLLEPAASPHQYQLKPSEARKLIEADAIIWVGPQLETFLGQVIRNNRSKPTLALTQRPRIEKLLIASDASEA